MIKHEFLAGKSKTGYPQQTLVIKVESLKNESLIEVINYLVSHVHVIYEKKQEFDEDVMWPIEFHLNDSLVLSESTFWKCVFESLVGGYEYIQRYIDVLCTLAESTKYGDLLQSNEYNFHGGLAFNQYWLWGIENPFPDRQENLKLCRQYCVWLSKNDLEFETYQDSFINIIFESYGQLDNVGTAMLLAIRLSEGQLFEKDFDYLRRVITGLSGTKSPGILKLVIEQLYNFELLGNDVYQPESIIYELCAVVYGSDERCTNEVMDYARSQANKELSKVGDNEMKKINYLRQVGDIYWQQVTSRNRYIDTSFHLFDTHTKKWIDYSERE